MATNWFNQLVPQQKKPLYGIGTQPPPTVPPPRPPWEEWEWTGTQPAPAGYQQPAPTPEALPSWLRDIAGPVQYEGDRAYVEYPAGTLRFAPAGEAYFVPYEAGNIPKWAQQQEGGVMRYYLTPGQAEATTMVSAMDKQMVDNMVQAIKAGDTGARQDLSDVITEQGGFPDTTVQYAMQQYEELLKWQQQYFEPSERVLRSETGPGGYQRDVIGYIDEDGSEVITGYTNYREPITEPTPTANYLRTETDQYGRTRDVYGYMTNGQETITGFGTWTEPGGYPAPEGGMPTQPYWSERLGQYVTPPGYISPFQQWQMGQWEPGQPEWLQEFQAGEAYRQAQLELQQQQLAQAQAAQQAEQQRWFSQMQQDWIYQQQQLGGQPRSWIDYWQMQQGIAPQMVGGQYIAGQPTTQTPGMPPWLSKILGGGWGSFKLPSTQQWQRMAPSQQQGYFGYTDWLNLPESDIWGQIQRLWPQWASAQAQWLPSRQRG